MYEMCGEREAKVFMVVCENQETGKAHACMECFEELWEVPEARWRRCRFRFTG